MRRSKRGWSLNLFSVNESKLKVSGLRIISSKGINPKTYKIVKKDQGPFAERQPIIINGVLRLSKYLNKQAIINIF